MIAHLTHSPFCQFSDSGTTHDWDITYDCGHTLRTRRFGGAPRVGDQEACPICAIHEDPKLDRSKRP